MKTQKVWFVTGASRGFGQEIVRAALAAGDEVVATVRKQPEQLLAALEQHPNLEVVVMDVTSGPQVQAAVQQAVQRFGQIDVLVNNAGYGFLGAVEEATEEEIHRQFDTNVFGLIRVTQAVLPHMRQRRSGHIINFSSLFGYQASIPGFGLYASSKFAVEGISEGLALELQPLGIYVTALAPGLFSTDFLAADSYAAGATVLEAYEPTVGRTRAAAGHIHGNQPGDPAKLAKVVLLLAYSQAPPVHLPVGRDAVAAFRSKVATMEAEVQAWESVAVSTDRTTEAVA
ncbi:SDR family NAD(P)-dependent oxidoreductase [Hymenobacter sp. 15J16-1T3B]|uniref:oxidoreductase n=1 Tax=Hymenobacter sp. 15J16-1T3B TaxID=2886941 RepID=UPI001D0F54B7|nr:oxidoreductase [Hymenobacter sp. 15J16-1T3B]MCC3158681.1 SDR family NAD(P)-dependent oxidoreductase [Hymenobacter sp. 15J16-1T3B]